MPEADTPRADRPVRWLASPMFETLKPTPDIEACPTLAPEADTPPADNVRAVPETPVCRAPVF